MKKVVDISLENIESLVIKEVLLFFNGSEYPYRRGKNRNKKVKFGDSVIIQGVIEKFLKEVITPEIKILDSR